MGATCKEIMSSTDSILSNPRQCWICFAEENPGFTEKWLRPCKCKGSTKWVHEECLLDWINSQLTSGSSSTSTQKLSCPQCHHIYKIVEQQLLPMPVLDLLDLMQKWKNRVIFISALSSISVGVYVLSFAYGSATFFITVGPEEAMSYFQFYGRPLLQLGRGLLGKLPPSQAPDLNILSVVQSWSKLILGMPMIPVWILSNRYRFFSSFTGAALPLALYYGPGSLSPSWPPTPNFTALLFPIVYDTYRNARSSLFSRLFPAPKAPANEDLLTEEEIEAGFGADDEFDREARVALRVSEDSVTTLLLLPTASALLGWALFRNTSMHGFHRSCIGGAILLLASDLGKALYQYQADYIRSSRKVIDYQS
jgi:E3 ubiquitin-protein ligase MARCH5